MRHLDEHERPAAKVVGQERGVRQLQHPTEGLARVGRRLGPVPPCLEDLRRTLDRPEQDTRVDLGNGEELELDGSHGRDVAAAATDRPEEVGLVLLVDAEVPAVGGDHLGRDDAVAGEPERADHPAEAATERIAEHADVRRGPGQIGETVLASRDREWLREHPGLDPRASSVRVDLDAAHPFRLQEQRVLAPVDGPRVVATGVERDAQPALCGEPDGRHDIVRGLWVDGDHGPLVDRQVPGLPRGVPGFVAGQDDGAIDSVAEDHGVAWVLPPIGRFWLTRSTVAGSA